jgi:chemotaxis protein methyltransferase CheR
VENDERLLQAAGVEPASRRPEDRRRSRELTPIAVPVVADADAADATDDLEELELDLLLTGIARRWGYDFRGYSPASLRRRVRKAMHNEQVRTLSALQERVLHRPESLQRFITALSVNVTGMFRDPQVYRTLRRQVLPMLRTYPFVRIWHAGCSTGEEVYSMAILLHEEGLLERCRIYATDISDDLLQRARRGVFPLRDMQEHTAAYHRAGGKGDFSTYYIADHQSAILRDELRRHLVFSQHNLVSDSSFNEFQLILCRNVLIYFSEALRERVHRLFYDSLVNFGILALGIRESMRFTPYADRYEPLVESLGLYRRVR